MADIRLAKPAAGAAETVPCAPEARFVFDFPATDATLARDGDNLAIQFEDGSRLNLEGFYTEYNEENLPSFSIDGTEVAAADFFAAMNEPDLMPAAGPGAGTPTGGRFHEWGDASLADGLEHLDGLDLSTGRAFTFDDTLNAVGGAPEGAYAALAGAAAPGTTPAPDNPVIITPDEPADLGPGITGAEHTLHEKHLANGSDAGAAPLMAEGSLSISAPDGVASIMVGFGADQIPVPVNGVVVPFTPAGHEEGTLTLRYDADAGRLEYTYTLDQATQEHGQEGQDERLFHDFTVTVTDTNRSTADSTIRVNIVDDAPEIGVTAPGEAISSGTTHVGSWSHNFGADIPEHKTITITCGEETVIWDMKIPSVQIKGEGGILQLSNDGTYTYEAFPVTDTSLPSGSIAANDAFTLTIEDADTDTDSIKLDMSVVNSAKSCNNILEFTTRDEDVASNKAFLTISVPEGFTVASNNGEALVSGWEHPDIGYFKVDNAADGSQTLTFVQTAPFTHGKGEGGALFEGISFVATDTNGNSVLINGSVSIQDDAPVGGYAPYIVKAGTEISGDIFHALNSDVAQQRPYHSVASAGADGWERVEWQLPNDKWEWEHSGATSGKAFLKTDYGILTVELKEDGSYTFDSTQADLDDSKDTITSHDFSYIIYDKDGDSSEGKLDLEIEPKGNSKPAAASFSATEQPEGDAGEAFLYKSLGEDGESDAGTGTDSFAVNDIAAYSPSDYFFDAPEDKITGLVADADTSLDELLGNGSVRNVEVLFKGADAMSLTSMEKLAKEYGIGMSEDGTRMTIPLAQEEGMNGWTDKGNGFYEHHDGDGKVDLTMETANLTAQESPEADQAALTLTLSAQG
ncbi:hypothetical protein [uncultured Desulfovibrio sp.]|uniref:hypothetical protein n=1 Tax=uncultured Desulfovibrio sp. TaxID=167968 RepID=UPI002804D039|nr:hypothetical protein [uncultured Desulfovibrio sp.]